MLEVSFGRSRSNFEGVCRRDFLRVGGLGFGGLTLGNLLAGRAAAADSGVDHRDTCVVWLWLNGGPTQIETFDPKMNAPVEYRSVTGEVSTPIPGVTMGGHFGQLAQQADKLAIVRSFVVPNNSHNEAAFWVNTGYRSAAKRPSLGSIASRVRGATHPVTGMPTYVRMNRVGYNEKANHMAGPAWLGNAFGPFTPDGPDLENMSLNMSVDRLDDRRALLSQLDRFRREADANGVMEGVDGFNQQAIDLVLGNSAQAFDLENEDPSVVARYGRGLGASLLTARRLCEAGCGFVLISNHDWDHHSSIQTQLDKRAPQVDQAVSAFVEDIYQRGLDKKILFVLSGEFGRTPRINSKGGRDHWGQLSTLALSGGGLEVGRTIGESSPKAEVPASNPVSVQDLMATVFQVLGIAPDIHFEDPSGRPTPMLENGTPIA